MRERFGADWQLPSGEVNDRSIFGGFVDAEPVVFDIHTTYLRIFAADAGTYDQIVHHMPTGLIVRARLHHPKLAELKAHLIISGYPVHYEDYPDPETIAWHAETLERENPSIDGERP